MRGASIGTTLNPSAQRVRRAEVENMDTQRIETVVIGGGQAGLAAGYHLAKAGRPFVILDANDRVGHAWRSRWDSLRLFSPARFSGLPGRPFPISGWYFPTKDELADYLEDYARHFSLPVRTGVRVTRVSQSQHGFTVESDRGRFEADHVIVASGHEHTPKVPGFARDLDPTVFQIHSSEYKRPAQLRPGGVLVVGAGNSGAEIAMDLSRTHPTWLSGRLRRAPVGPSRSPVMTAVIWPIVSHVLTIDTPMGRKMRPKMLQSTAPVERVTEKALAAAGVQRAARTIGARGGAPLLEDGNVVDVANVIWCTGYRSDLGWIDLPIFDGDGEPLQTRGVVETAPGLYFVGRWFQYAFTSLLIGGVGRDAGYIAKQIVKRVAATSRSTSTDMSRVSRSA
jgi:putative flavoprotein involved in K+ transport